MAYQRSGAVLARALDAVNAAVFVLDREFRVLFVNKCGAALLARGASGGKRLGDKIGCGHALHAPEGCGTSPFCRKCVVRRIVEESFRTGKPGKSRLMFRKLEDGELHPAPAIVSAAPFNSGRAHLCLLTIDDLSGLAELHSLLPICASCKKIRMEADYWEQIEVYINKHLADIKFTHGVCPACAKKLYPELTV